MARKSSGGKKASARKQKTMFIFDSKKKGKSPAPKDKPAASRKKDAAGAKGGAKVPAADGFLKTGITGLDNLFEHGIPKNSAVLVAGGAGSGKTLMSLQILYNAAMAGRKCLYMSFEESTDRLEKHMQNFGWNLGNMKKNLVIQKFNLFDITRSIDAMLAKQSGELMIDVEPVIFPEGFKPDIVVVDSLTSIASAFQDRSGTYRIYIEQLFRYFEKMNISSFMISETEQMPKVFSPTGVEEFLADGVLVLYNIRKGNVRENAIEVLKMRGTKHQKKVVAMQIISKTGIEIFPDQEVFSMRDGGD